MRYAEGHASHRNRIVAPETAVRQLWVHLVCTDHSAREKRMSRGHVCVAICDLPTCVRPDI